MPKSLISIPIVGSNLIPATSQISTISFAIKLKQALAFGLLSTSPNRFPVTADIPLIQLLRINLDHRAPIRFSTICTGPICSRTPATLIILSLIFPSISPISNKVSPEVTFCVTSETPGDMNVAPQSTVPPTVLFPPKYSDTLYSGTPFCNVQTTLSSLRYFLRCGTASAFAVCFINKNTISYFPSICWGVIAFTGTVMSAQPIICAPFSFSAFT